MDRDARIHDLWYKHLNKVSPGMGDRYRRTGMRIPNSRTDLWRFYGDQVDRSEGTSNSG
jgi:hypothetical protein